MPTPTRQTRSFAPIAARTARLCLLALVLVALVSPALAKKDKAAADDVDYIALAARLVQDGHFDRASLTLDQVDEGREDLDRKLYFVLRGLIALQNKLYKDAAVAFEAAVAAGNVDPLVFINLGRAHFGAKDYKQAIAALKRAGASARQEPRAELLLAQSYWELSRRQDALTVLRRADANFSDSNDFARLEMSYLIKLELYQELSRRRDRFLRRDGVQAQDIVAIAEALRRSGQLKEAQSTLEAARLRFPSDIDVSVQLARVLMDEGKLLSSAMVLEHAARQDEKYLIEAAEMYRRAGRLVRALVINKRVPDQKAKMRQRLQLLLELERFEMVSGMESRLSRLGLLGDPQIRYALAYGFFQIRDFPAAERHLAQITDAELFEKGIALRNAIRACKDAGWQCH